MVWAGGMPLGLFTGIRTFVLTPAASGDVAFAMERDLSRTARAPDHPIDP